MDMRSSRLWCACVLSLGLWTAGCGQKGPLYMPDQTAPASTAQPVDDTSAARQPR
ncbi:LPS translocon maturation chaperone LptM [Hydrogenophaga aquatica]